MKVLLVCVAAVAAVFVAVQASKCAHGDVSMCSGINCTNPGETLVCEHDVCTCSGAGAGGAMPCVDLSDCSSMHCDKHTSSHCVDFSCRCVHLH